MSEATFTFRLENNLKQSFSAAAKASDRTGAQLLRDFMRDFVKQQQAETTQLETLRAALLEGEQSGISTRSVEEILNAAKDKLRNDSRL